MHLVERGIVRRMHLAIDSAPLEAYFRNDKDAQWVYNIKFGYYKGYKVHVMVDAKSELPISIEVTPANIA